MTQAKSFISIQCPEHQAQYIGILDTNCSAKKLGYCFERITKDNVGAQLPKTVRTMADYLKETSDFYNKCRQRAHNTDEPPSKFTDELSKKAERLERLSRHIENEKQKVKGRFEEVRKNILEVIHLKEKECIRLLEDEITGLSSLYTQCEELIAKGWPQISDLEARYPTSNVLEQRISRIANLDQLQAFVKGVAEDIQIENKFYGEYGLQGKIASLISHTQRVESSLPVLQGKLLDSSSEDL